VKNHSATVSSKGQICIPIKIRNELKVKTGDTIDFILQGDVITMQKGIRFTCPACKGKKDINDKKCFVCDGSSEINPNVSLFHEIERVVNYSISVNVNNDRSDDENLSSSFPKIQVHTKRYPKNVIAWYQDYLQAKAVEQFVDRGDIENNTLDITDIVDSFNSKEVKAAIIKHLPSVKRLSELVITIND
jgi:AbrB family looped-hinge helix DNA binding protein